MDRPIHFKSRKLGLLVVVGVVAMGGIVGRAQTPPPTAPPQSPLTVNSLTKFSAPTGALQNPKAAEALLIAIDVKHRATWKGKPFTDFVKQAYKEPFPGGKYIVDGDTSIADIKHLQEFYATKIQATAAQKASSTAALVLSTVSGEDNAWARALRSQLTYCVSKAFGAQYAKVVSDMDSATQAWMSVAAVKFSHVTGEDTSCTADNSQVMFDIRPVNVDGKYLARSFFPNDERPQRNVLIDDTAFEVDPAGKLQLVGILRHELGHTLGFRHEHTRPEAGTCFEDSDWRPVTDYDALSVMHYPQCNGAGDWSLVLTDKDKSGAACVYGAATGFMIDTHICTPVPVAAAAIEQPATVAILTQQVAAGAETFFGPYAARPGTAIKIQMSGASGAGDPDLYVRLGAKPDSARGLYSCRPYLTGPNELCNLDAGLPPHDKVYVMVRGYSAGKFDLNISVTPP
jgi:serine protease